MSHCSSLMSSHMLSVIPTPLWLKRKSCGDELDRKQDGGQRTQSFHLMTKQNYKDKLNNIQLRTAAVPTTVFVSRKTLDFQRARSLKRFTVSNKIIIIDTLLMN